MVNGVNTKNPVLAAVFSFFFPGLGQVYDGRGYLKGLLFVIGSLIGSLLIIPGFLIWLYGVYNAYAVAKKVNTGLIPYKHVGAVSLIVYAILSFAIVFVGIVAVTFVLAAVIVALGFAIGGTSGY